MDDLKFCVNCKHFDSDGSRYNIHKHCLKYERERDLITGDRKYVSAWDARHDEKMCGKSAVGYELDIKEAIAKYKIDVQLYTEKCEEPKVTLMDAIKNYQKH
jgi:hypothetical protein